MPNLSVRDVGTETYSALKRLAVAHHRSLQGEVRHILAEAAKDAPANPVELDDIHIVESGRNGTWSREEIYDAGDR